MEQTVEWIEELEEFTYFYRGAFAIHANNDLIIAVMVPGGIARSAPGNGWRI